MTGYFHLFCQRCDHISLLISTFAFLLLHLNINTRVWRPILWIDPSNEVSFGQLFDQLKDPLKTMSQAGDLLFTFANLSFTIGLDLWVTEAFDSLPSNSKRCLGHAPVDQWPEVSYFCRVPKDIAKCFARIFLNRYRHQLTLSELNDLDGAAIAKLIVLWITITDKPHDSRWSTQSSTVGSQPKHPKVLLSSNREPQTLPLIISVYLRV
jgi:hypothetical protein